MKKWFTILILLVVIIGTFGFALLKVGSLGDWDNWFNSRFRPGFSEHKILREIFSLHNPGDARFDYFSENKERVIIEMDTLEGSTLHPETLPVVERMLGQLLEKPIKIITSTPIPAGEAPADELASRFRSFRSNKTESVIYLLVLAASPEHSTQIGSTFREDGVIIYTKAIADLGYRSPVALETTTILHEFLHQLGLPHVNDPHCIMFEAVEVGSITGQVPTELCEEEQQLLDSIRTETINQSER